MMPLRPRRKLDILIRSKSSRETRESTSGRCRGRSLMLSTISSGRRCVTCLSVMRSPSAHQRVPPTSSRATPASMQRRRLSCKASQKKPRWSSAKSRFPSSTAAGSVRSASGWTSTARRCDDAIGRRSPWEPAYSTRSSYPASCNRSGE